MTISTVFTPTYLVKLTNVSVRLSVSVHTEGELESLFVQVQPFSIAQLAEQPSPLRLLPSSQGRIITRPSPHIYVQVLVEAIIWKPTTSAQETQPVVVG